MLYWKKLCGKALIIPKHKSVALFYSLLVSFTISSSFILGKMCITFHLYRNSHILLYLFKTNRVLWDEKKKQGPPNIPVKCGMFHLYLFPVADTWRSSETCETRCQPELRCFCSRPVQAPFVEPKNLWPYFIVISLFSVFINCTVLLNFASTVMIKWWLSSSVTFTCRCCLSWRILVSGSGYCFHCALKCFMEIQFRESLRKIFTHNPLIFWISIWDHSG